VIADWKMPGTDGVALLRALHEDAALAGPPVILMVGAYGVQALRQAAGDLPLAGLLTKPFSAPTLREAIESAFGLAPAAALRRAPEGPAAAAARSALAGARILLVEDNAVNQEVGVGLLQRAGAHVSVAGNGREALARLADEPFDAVLMDVQMPVMDGLEACRAIRLEPRFAALPIIAMTAGALPEERMLTAQAGMNDHLTKPIDSATLEATLARWLARPAAQPLATQPLAALPPAKAAPAPAASEMTLNVAAGLQLLDGSVGLYRRVLETFLADIDASRQRLRAALAAGDPQALRRLAHSTKGAAATVGAQALRAAAQALEQACNAGAEADATACQTLGARLDAEWDAVGDAVRHFLATETVPGAA
jgi:CheY-like chemotaxis protein/HPt (histidine-containing phosphotransfer) domain-containing protein